MAAEAEVMDELRRLRARVPQLTGALAASVDGLVLVQDTPGVEPETVAALTATALSVAVRMADATGQGDFRELLVRGTYGYVATYAAGRSAVLTLLAQDRVNVGRLHLEGRRAGIRIGELVDTAAEQASGPTATPTPTQTPMPTPNPMPTPSPTTPTTTPTTPTAPAPMPTRTRTPRAPRTPSTTPNARTTTEN